MALPYSTICFPSFRERARDCPRLYKFFWHQTICQHDFRYKYRSYGTHSRGGTLDICPEVVQNRIHSKLLIFFWPLVLSRAFTQLGVVIHHTALATAQLWTALGPPVVRSHSEIIFTIIALRTLSLGKRDCHQNTSAPHIHLHTLAAHLNLGIDSSSTIHICSSVQWYPMGTHVPLSFIIPRAETLGILCVNWARWERGREREREKEREREREGGGGGRDGSDAIIVSLENGDEFTRNLAKNSRSSICNSQMVPLWALKVVMSLHFPLYIVHEAGLGEERERERETERERGERQRDRQTDRQTETDSVWEREAETERERRKWRHHCHAENGDEFILSVAKNRTLHSATRKWSILWRWNWRWVHIFLCQKICTLPSARLEWRDKESKTKINRSNVQLHRPSSHRKKESN